MPRGVKTCPACKKDCGPRTYTCDCGHVFKIKAASEQEQPEERGEEQEESGSKSVVVRNGICPVAWTGKLDTWIAKVKREVHYWNGGLIRFWLRSLVQSKAAHVDDSIKTLLDMMD